MSDLIKILKEAGDKAQKNGCQISLYANGFSVACGREFVVSSKTITYEAVETSAVDLFSIAMDEVIKNVEDELARDSGHG